MKNLYPILIFLFAGVQLIGQSRVTDDLLDLYTFSEGNGEFVHDVSGMGFPSVLEIEDPSKVEWQPGGGIRFMQPTIIRSLYQAQDLYQGVTASNELTIEAWLKPTNSSQSGPARIVTVSHGTSEANAMLTQNNSAYGVRMRTTSTDLAGNPMLSTASNATSNSQMQHVVYTRTSNGAEKIFIDGVEVKSGTRTGNCSNWYDNYRLAIGNEIDADRPWLGTVYLVATYSRALSSDEVVQNHAAGAIQPGGMASSESCPQENCFIDGYGSSFRSLWLPSLPNGILENFEFDSSGGHFEVFEDGTAHMYGNCINMSNPDYGFYMDFWFTGRMNWTEWSALGRSWKGTSSIVGNLYTTWDYYIMDSSKENVLIGMGNYEGSLLNVTHRPSDYTYGLQIGLAANDKNQEPGMSCWFDYTGTINGNTVANHGDINLEGGCEDLPVLNCAVDITVDCVDGGFDPVVTGSPIIYCEQSFDLSYADAIVAGDCPMTIIRTWTAIDINGNEATCTQNITVVDDIAPVIFPMASVTNDCEFMLNASAVASDNCSEVAVSIDVLDSYMASDCTTGQLRTQTQGGWGTNPNGNNPGVYLNANFNGAFPNGLTIGCGPNTLSLTTAQAVRDFLPSGSSPSALSGALVNPGGAYNNVLAGQLVAATLSAEFDAYDANFGASGLSLGDLFFTSGPHAGWSVSQLLDYANQAIGGCVDADLSALNESLSILNENFVDGTTDNGNLACAAFSGCALAYDVLITAVDACGNQSTLNQTVFVQDNEAPSFLNAPMDITVECGQIPEPSIEFEDGCFTSDVLMSVIDEEFSGACMPTIQRTYTLTDPCGNVSTHVQYITVIDTQAPTFVNAPSNLVLQCGDPIPATNVQAIDNCVEPNVVFNEVATALDCGQLIVRTWSASDVCGNTEVLVQEILIQDNEGPVADIQPANMEVGCDAIPAMSDIQFEDACSTVTSVLTNETQNGEGCEYDLIRTWTAVDACGNSTVVSQSIHVIDNQAPVFTAIPQDLILACGAIAPDQSPMVADQCGDVSLSLNEVWMDDAGFCSVLQRTWTATDACGNSSSATQVVSWADADGPVLGNVPASGSASCNDLESAPVVTAIDACDGTVPVFMDEVMSVQGCEITLSRTWTATDMCGNTTTATQVLIANDVSAPVISGNPVLSIECSELDDESLVVVADDCLFAVELTYVDVFVGAGAALCQETYQRTYTATDVCGNTSTFAQLLNVVDNTSPVFTFVPADVQITCGQSAALVDAIAFDACSEVSLSFEEVSVNGECGDEKQRIWTAIDDCGNTSTAIQMVTYVDEISPIITGVPASIAISCTEGIPAAPQVSVTDNCDVAVFLIYNQTTYPGSCPGNYQIVRSWSATDACGNMAVQTQTISVSDNEAPVFDFIPADETADCGNLPEPAVLTATDNCSEVSVSFSQTVGSGGCPNIFRTWVATDACGNATTVTQTIFVEDNEPPLLSGIPSNTQVDCNSIPDMPTPDVSDNCDDNVAITMNESIVGSGCFYTIIRTWIASDDCGNTTIVSQSIQVEDTEAPIFINVPAEMTVECSNVGALPLPQVIDDCGNSVSIVSEDVILGIGCTYDIQRTYTATDLCGHQAQATMTIHVIDTTPPVITGVGPNTFVSCNNIPGANNAVAVDACGGQVSLSVVDTQIGNGCSYIISRTYNAIDACGNGTSLTQLIYVQDNAAPVFIGVPDHLVISCNDPVPGVAQVGALDNCSGAPQVNFFQFTEDSGCSQIITRVWSAADACGNQATATQTITITDTQAPTFSFVPANATVECGAIPAPEMAIASDNCTANVSVEMVEEIIAGGCPFEIRRVYIATDDCGNEATAIQSIFVTDNQAPTLSFYPADEAVTCETFTEAPVVQAIDNCSGVEVVYNETWGAPGCVQTLTRSWTATDNCGNSVQHTQVVTITDTHSPVFSSMPENLVINCLQVPAMANLVAIDDCNNTVVESFELVEATDCISEYTLIRNWIVTDACGNTATAVQTIVVIDDIAPILVGVPEDLVVDCNNVPEIPEVTALESCGEEVDVVFIETVIGTSQTSVCEVGNSAGFNGDIALWLNGTDVFAGNYIYGPEGGSFWVDPVTNEAHLVGQVFNTLNANFSWMIDITLGEERSWEEWSALGREYKDDLGVATDEYQDWLFYVMNGNNSRLIGMGAFEGNELNLTHAPADSTFGFQLGMHANNHSEGFGLGGWFFYEGVFAGEAVSGHGDVFTIHYCCEEHQIVRTWTATDCAGNSTTFSQTIDVMSQQPTDPNMLIFPTIEAMDFDVTGTDGEQFIITFTPDYSGKAHIEVFDNRGQCVGVVGQMEVIESATYTLRYPKSHLPDGAYIFTLTGNKKIVADTEMVLH